MCAIWRRRASFAPPAAPPKGWKPIERELLALLAARDYEAFMGLAVRSKKNIVVSGATGSGKTTFTKASIREIPREERLITIEDAPELVLNDHPNHVRLFYSKGDQGQAKVAPKQLLESCLRMRPDRILLAELRSDEAFDYLRNANSGHPGSITSVHASSADLAFEQLTLLVKQSASGGDLPRPEIKTLLYLLVDIVVQFAVVGAERRIREIWYEPARKRALATARLSAPCGTAPLLRAAGSRRARQALIAAQYLAGYLFLWVLALRSRTARHRSRFCDTAITTGDPADRPRRAVGSCSGAGLGARDRARRSPRDPETKAPARRGPICPTPPRSHARDFSGHEGLILGEMGSRYLMLAGQQSVILAAPPRSGKDVGRRRSRMA